MRFDLIADGFAPSAVSTDTSRGAVSTAAHGRAHNLFEDDAPASRQPANLRELVHTADILCVSWYFLPTPPRAKRQHNYCHGLDRHPVKLIEIIVTD